MAKIVQLFTYVCCVFVIINAVNIVVKLIVSLSSSTYRLQQRHNDSFCSCPCQLYTTMRYVEPFDRIVTLPKSLLTRKTLTRVGSDLDFDYNSCPSSSFMLDATKQNSSPLHNDCPLLFIIGAQRSGTTSLYQYLSRHSDFRGFRVDKGPLSGETYHFTSRYKSEAWEKYRLHFPMSALSGEKSTGMFNTCEAPKWLYESCGRTSKVILLLRNPTNRYVSAMGSKQVQRLLIQVISDIETYDEIKQTQPQQFDHDVNCVYSAENHLYIGLYSLHLANWLCNFPSENILLLNSEEFRKSSAEILQLVLEFVNLQPFTDYKLNVVVNITYNEGKNHEDTGNDVRLLGEVYKKLDNIYRSHNKELFKILHWSDSTVDWPT